MSATNHTTNYNLPQFIGTDIPSWLSDVNGAMSSIDTAIKTAADAAGAAATLATNAKDKADGVELSLGTTNSNVSTLQGTVETQGIAIGANTTKIGNAPLATTAQNLSGAVNELVARIPSETTKYDLLGRWLENGTQTLPHPLSDYRFIVLVGYAVGVVYEIQTIPVELLVSDTDMADFTYCLDTHLGSTEHRIDIKFNSEYSATVTNRSALNLRVYGVK